MSDESILLAAKKVESLLLQKKVHLTMGGEPTLVPDEPDGAEWSITAVGPTKLRYAYAFANELNNHLGNDGAIFYSPGKSYPGETNPRWILHYLSYRSGEPFIRTPLTHQTVTPSLLQNFRLALTKKMHLKPQWIKALPVQSNAWILPLDHDEKKFVSANWKKKSLHLLHVDAPAGLRLPLHEIPETLSRRALTLEIIDGALAIFFPPLLQKPFLELLNIVDSLLTQLQITNFRFQGYIPSDEGQLWQKTGVACDPGVLEINIPPCSNWLEYRNWMDIIDLVGKATGLRTYKVAADGESGTGGGNHICLGGPTLDNNPFFTRPGWITSILRFWQHHPSLSYVFTGIYVGASSQAPRTDESARGLHDLEMAYQYLEALPRGDHRLIINETLRHLHIDGSGNTHRSEISFDKFWNTAFPGGSTGILEFRAVETLPNARWTSAVGLLWRALAAVLLTHPYQLPLKDFSGDIHDRYFLPSYLWQDLVEVLAFLREHGVDLPLEIFREIWEWRFPLLLATRVGTTDVSIRKALESWPLLCEQPLEGGSTSRFVDTSIGRLEITASSQISVQFRGRKLPLSPFPTAALGAGLRFRKSALYPCLHPGIAPQLPLEVVLIKGKQKVVYQLPYGAPAFEGPIGRSGFKPAAECRRSAPTSITFDLRLP